ncbi:MAG: DUF2269 family protein [Pseudomonadota bacterium]
MSLSDWLLALHVLSAIILIGSLTALWALIVATRPAAPLIAAESARAYGRLAGPLVGVGMVGTILLGIWLAIDLERYHPWDAWIVASIVLWAVGGWAGGKAGREFDRDPVGGRPAGIRYQAFLSLAVVVILVLMIWKPGA